MKMSVVVSIALAIIVVVFLFPYSRYLFQAAPEVPMQVGTKTYAKDTYGISFSYPAAYLLSEGMRGTILDERFQVILIHEADVNIPTGGEGPTALTVELYDMGDAPTSLQTWLTDFPQSNYGLGDGALKETTVDGLPAVEYSWSGLYEGKTVAFVRGTDIVLISVTYLAPEDPIVGDFRALLDSFHITR